MPGGTTGLVIDGGIGYEGVAGFGWLKTDGGAGGLGGCGNTGGLGLGG